MLFPIEAHDEEIQCVCCLLVVLVDEKESGKTTVTIRVEEFEFVGQGDEVAASLVEAAVDAGKVPKAAFLLVGPFGLGNHKTAILAKRLEMAILLLVPTVHLIAHGLHLLGSGSTGKE